MHSDKSRNFIQIENVDVDIPFLDCVFIFITNQLFPIGFLIQLKTRCYTMLVMLKVVFVFDNAEDN